MSSEKGSRCTRSAGPVLDPDLVFPPREKYQPSSQLPTNGSVISMVRFLLHPTGHVKASETAAFREVAKQVYAKYFHDNICCQSISTIQRRVKQLWGIFWEGRKRLQEKGGKTFAAVISYKDLVSRKDELFDVSATDPQRKKDCEEAWGVKMTAAEEQYLEDQRSSRKMECSKAVDPIWYMTTMKEQRRKEREEGYRRQRDEQFRFKSLDDITKLLLEHGDDPMATSSTENTPAKDNDFRCEQTGKRRRLFVDQTDDQRDPMPPEYRHVRESERVVKEQLYRTVANLCGHGLSIDEASKAVCEVANGMFGRSWKLNDQVEGEFGMNTLPAKPNIRQALNLLEAESLSLTADEVMCKSNDGRMITHAIDSTTKKRVGQFAVQGIHIGQELPFPLPLTNICGETTEEIALQVDLGFEILAAVKGKPVEEIYKHVDAHITDSTEHNKGFNAILQEMYGLDSPAGQLFCGTHTTLGFSSALNKTVRTVECDMKIENVLAGFMVGMDVSSKNSSVAGQTLDMCLKLVAPEYSHKVWNYHDLFISYLKKHGVPVVLFAYKDQRFGCLSRAAGVMVFYYDHLSEFLGKNPQICNRLACLVREVLALPYLKTVFAVFASFGIQLIEPFYAKTITKGATHSDLKVFYRSLFENLSEPVGSDFFDFGNPAFLAVSEELFARVKDSYGKETLSSVIQMAAEHKEELVKLANLMLPEVRTVLARQRRDYGLDEEVYPARFPVSEQVSNIDDTPVHNMSMERLCGTADFRLKKLGTLAAVSRSIVLDKTKDLRAGSTSSMRSFKDAVKAKREVELKWSERMQKKLAEGADEKQVLAQRQERKRLNMLDSLKAVGGPFTHAAEVKEYVELRSGIDSKMKQQRLKKEVQFARESSTTLPKSDPIFRIRITMPNKKSRDKTAVEFGESLMAYLGNKEDRQEIGYAKFQESLKRLATSQE